MYHLGRHCGQALRRIPPPPAASADGQAEGGLRLALLGDAVVRNSSAPGPISPPLGTEPGDMGLTPHDRLVQYVFGDPAHAASLLRAVLPAAVAQRIEWGSFRRENASYTNEQLEGREGDLLFSALVGARRAFFYVMFEHQSRVDRFMAARVHMYTSRIWEEFRRSHAQSAMLPAVLPIVLFHDTGPWNAPTDVKDLLDLDADSARAMAPYLPRHRFLLVDLDGMQDEARRRLALTALVRLALVLMRDTRKLGWAELRGRLGGWREAFMEVLRAPGGVAAASALMHYILSTSPASQDEVRDFALELGPAAEEAVMTAGEQLIQEGMARGIVQGEAMGIAKGKAESVLRILDRRYGPLSDDVVARVWGASLEELDHLLDRALVADTLEGALG
jgi:predicted transposase/invertase (TIGR01784 family)